MRYARYDLENTYITEALEDIAFSGPVGISKAAEVLNIPVWLILNAVSESHCLVLDHGRVTYDQQVEDPDYGLIYKKEQTILRKLNVPTLEQIKRRCGRIDRRKRPRKRHVQ